MVWKNIDKGNNKLLSPLVTYPFVYFTCGFVIVIVYFYILIVSLLHAGFLLIFPYINGSDFYRYITMNKKFYQKNLYYKHLFSRNTLVSSKIVIFFSFYLLLNTPVV